MSEKGNNQSNERVDFETAETVLGRKSSKSRDENDPALGKMLPKLSKRISQSQGIDCGDYGESRLPEAKLNSSHNADQEERIGAEEAPLPRPPKQQHQPRASVTASAGSSERSGVTVMVRPSAGLAPELEKLRLQDINPDQNSAASLALSAANGNGASSGPNSASSPESTDGGGAPMKRRISVSRQLSGRYQRSTNRKVEGREIQQDHSQYALTYGLMLGIRVMTGRRDLALDRRTSMSRKAKKSKNKSKKKGKGKSGDEDDDEEDDAVDVEDDVPAPPPPPAAAAAAPPAHNGIRSALSFSLGSNTNGNAESAHGAGGGGITSSISKHFDNESAQQMLVERELTVADFDEDLELKFHPRGTSGPVPTPPHKLNFSFKFKDYMPAVFRAVRSLSNIDEADYMLSLAGDFNYIEFIANSKSGQFFFYSHDGCYMIKTQSKEECVLLREIMPSYVSHLSQHPNSLLVRFYGMHRVKFKTKKIYFVIMSSVFNTEKPIDIKFDLKGSLAGRRTSPESCKQGAVQKDLNLMESGRKIRLGEENVEMFRENLLADAMLMASLNIMDYSLLVGIHEKKAVSSTSSQRRASGVVLSQQQQQRASVLLQSAAGQSDGGGVADPYGEPGSLFQSYYGGIPSARGVDEIYFMGIIDILQLYNLNKQTETFYKGLFSDRMLQSSIRPDLYASRFVDFIMKHTDYDEVMAARASAAKASGEKSAREDLL